MADALQEVLDHAREQSNPSMQALPRERELDGNRIAADMLETRKGEMPHVMPPAMPPSTSRSARRRPRRRSRDCGIGADRRR